MEIDVGGVEGGHGRGLSTFFWRRGFLGWGWKFTGCCRCGVQQGCTALSRLPFELVAHLHPTHSLSSVVAVTPWKDLLERVPGGMNEWNVSTTMHMHSRVVKVQLLAFQRNQKVLEEGKEGKHNI
jgi:hypothetical protein